MTQLKPGSFRRLLRHLRLREEAGIMDADIKPGCCPMCGSEWKKPKRKKNQSGNKPGKEE